MESNSATVILSVQDLRVLMESLALKKADIKVKIQRGDVPDWVFREYVHATDLHDMLSDNLDALLEY